MTKLKLIIATAVAMAIFIVPSLASADVNNFMITSFNSDETLTRTEPQGQLKIRERINVDFTDNNHGILRALPNHYKNHSLQLHIDSVSSDSNAPDQYTTYQSSGNTVLKIGDPNSTVTGNQEYNIAYTLNNVITFYKDHDELYWNVNGDQWGQSFENVATTLHLPDGLTQNRSPLCYTGSYGSNASDCVVAPSNPGTITVTTQKPLAPYQTLTYVAGFKTGYFQPYKWYDLIKENLVPLLKFFMPIIVLGGGSFLYWVMLGRDPKGRGIIIPQYEAPDGLLAAEVGTIADFKLDNRDISATIIDLAVRGYIKIIETKKTKALRKDELIYILQLLKDDLSDLTPYERDLIIPIFGEIKIGSQVDVSSLKNQLYTTAKQMRENVENGLTTAGYFRANPLRSGQLLASLVSVMFIIVFIVSYALGFALAAGTLVGAAIAYIFSRFMGARTAKGVAANESIQGLKLFMEVTQKDRLARLQSPGVSSAASNEPAQTVQLFEKLLPYAMALGVEGKWSKQFEGIYQSPPNWYSGNWTTFNSFYLVNSLNAGLNSAVNTAFSAPRSSGSSGFGGGFAGGGGGGGGGGGW